jgi:hypothetical protein
MVYPRLRCDARRKAGIRPTFKVAGQEFTLRKRLPYATWNKLLAAMRSPEADDDQQKATKDFFDKVLVRADRERFATLLDFEGDDEDDDDAVIGLDQMDQLTDWVMQIMTGKAPKNETSSTAGLNTTGPAPNVVSLSSKQPANA